MSTKHQGLHTSLESPPPLPSPPLPFAISHRDFGLGQVRSLELR